MVGMYVSEWYSKSQGFQRKLSNSKGFFDGPHVKKYELFVVVSWSNSYSCFSNVRWLLLESTMVEQDLV